MLKWSLLKPAIKEHMSPLCYLHVQYIDYKYHVCWWPGDLRRQVIRSHVIDLVNIENFVASTQGLTVFSSLINNMEPEELNKFIPLIILFVSVKATYVSIFT